MLKEEWASMSDDELKVAAKKMKSARIWSALVIGIMLGVIIYSIVAQSVGIFTLIPLFFIYKIVNGSDRFKNLKEVLKEKGLS